MSLTDIPGLKVGHSSDYDGLTGCTVVLAENGAVAGGDVRGSAVGMQEGGLLDPMHVTDRIHAICFAGGSAFGLEAASGVRRFLGGKGIGFKTGAGTIPLIVGAILYDLGIGRNDVHPTLEMGERAAAAASSEPVAEGVIGAGTGATVGKLLGVKHAMKSGVGSWTVKLDGANAGGVVSALAVVNAIGDVRDPSTGNIVAGTRTSPASKDFADSSKLMKSMGPTGFTRGSSGTNTTLVVVATNAALNKVQATKLAQLGQLGIARTIYPVNTMSDGDVVIALSTGSQQSTGPQQSTNDRSPSSAAPVIPIDALGVAAAEAVSEAILRAVRLATTLGGVPGLKS